MNEFAGEFVCTIQKGGDSVNIVDTEQWDEMPLSAKREQIKRRGPYRAHIRAGQIKIVLEEIKQVPGINGIELQYRMLSKMDAKETRSIIRSLLYQKMIRAEKQAYRSSRYYPVD